MQVAVIGPLEVRTDDLAPVLVPGAQERLLLAALVAGAPDAVSTDALVAALWDGDPPPTPLESLRAHIVHLRGALEPGLPANSSGRYVVRRGHGYVLAVPDGDIDALRIGALAARGRALLAAGDTAGAERLLTAALGLWRGQPYADCPDAPFVGAERRRLTEIRADAEADLAEARRRLPERSAPRAALPEPVGIAGPPVRAPAATSPGGLAPPPPAPEASPAGGPLPAERGARREDDAATAPDGRPASAGRRTVRVAVLAGLLVATLVAAVLAVRSQQEGERDTAVTVDAQRLTRLATTEGRLDVSLLLRAQGFRLADTAETQDGLLTALAEHRRVERAVPFSGTPHDPVLSGGGRTLMFGAGDRMMAWPIESPDPPQIVLDIPEEWGAWLVAAPSPTEDLVMAAGEHAGVPWLRKISPTDGSSHVLLQGAALGGLPLDGVVTADGRRLLLLTARDEGSPTSSRWQLIDVDIGNGARQDTGIGGTFPAPFHGLEADFADDGGSFVLWAAGATATPATLVQLPDGRQTPVDVRQRSAGSDGFLALPSGAAQLWDDGAVNLIDRAGITYQQLGQHEAPVRAVVVSPDGTWAVTAGDDTEVLRWHIDGPTGRWVGPETLAGHREGVVGAQLAGDGRRLVTVSLDGLIIVWDMGDGAGIGEPYAGLGQRRVANRPAVVEPGGLLVAPTVQAYVGGAGAAPPDEQGETLSATFFDAASGAVVTEVVVGQTLAGPFFASSVAVSPDRSMVAVTWGLGVTVLDTRTREEIARIVLPAVDGVTGAFGEPLPAAVVWCAAWTPDGSRLLLGTGGDVGTGSGGAVLVVDTRTWDVVEEIDIGGPAQVMETSPDGGLFAVARVTASGVVLLDSTSLEVVRTVPLATGEGLGALSFSPDGRLLAAGSGSGRLHVLDTRTWRPVRDPVGVHRDLVLQAEWLPDNNTVVTTGLDGTVSLFDVSRGTVRGWPLPASGGPGPGSRHLLPGPAAHVVAVGGEGAGRRYPMDPAVWLSHVCAIVGRDLTPAEWGRYLPSRAWQPTCSNLP